MPVDDVRPNDKGAEVTLLHQALAERGALPPAAQWEIGHAWYGPASVGAVKTFQAKHHLVVDGIVGPKTWDALNGRDDDAPLEPIPAPDYDSMGELPARALKIADGEWRAGVCETPYGLNRGGRGTASLGSVDEYLLGHRRDGAAYVHWQRDDRAPDGWQGAPWCGRFALWCVEEAAQQLGADAPTKGGGDYASNLKWRDWALAAHRWVLAPKPGNVGVITVPAQEGRTAHGHVVLVASVDGPGKRLCTREGNSRGQKVNALHRAWTEFAGFVELG